MTLLALLQHERFQHSRGIQQSSTQSESYEGAPALGRQPMRRESALR
jgi:hypothetical protein